MSEDYSNYEGPSANEKVMSLSNDLNKVLNFGNPICGEYIFLKEIYSGCLHITQLSMIISIFYLWMFCKSYFYDYSIGTILCSYITSQLCFCAALYGVIKYKLFNGLKFRKKIIKMLNDLKKSINSDDFSLIDENDQSEIPDKIREIEDLVEELEMRGMYSQKDILLANMTLLSCSVTSALLVMYCSSNFASSTSAIVQYVIFVVSIAYCIETYLDRIFDTFQSHDFRSKHEIKKNVLGWIKTSSTGSTGSTM